jgi:pimeloyl-ACP methyl ester carboxylesterase
MSRCARLGAVQIEVVSADGTTLVARGYGSGPPVVLVHGSSGGLDSWDGVAPFLADAFEVWVYARRGYAPSGEGTDDKTFTDDVADLLAVVQAAGGDAHVVGASYGGTVGLHAAASNPVVMRSLALFEPPLFASGTALLPVLESYESLIASGPGRGRAAIRREGRAGTDHSAQRTGSARRCPASAGASWRRLGRGDRLPARPTGHGRRRNRHHPLERYRHPGVAHAGFGQLAPDPFNDGASRERDAICQPRPAGRSIPFRNPNRTRPVRGETTELPTQTRRLTSESPDSPQHPFQR